MSAQRIIGPGGVATPDPEERFRGLPILVEYVDGHIWGVARAVSYRLQSGAWSTVRTGFMFDWASAPWFLWPLCPPAGLTGQPYGIAALWHDWLYAHKHVAGVAISRLDADRVFVEIMLYVGVSPWRAWAMYGAVRAFGWWPWGVDRSLSD